MLFIAVCHHAAWVYVTWLGVSVCVGFGGWGTLCMHRVLIPASTSNYLNCAYRSYCTVHFPLESYTLSSCLPAALAVEISTLGNFVLHNNYCTWGMFLSKNVWTERKNSFLAQPHAVLLFPCLFCSPLFCPSLLVPGEMSFSTERPFFLMPTTPHYWLPCDFTISR